MCPRLLAHNNSVSLYLDCRQTHVLGEVEPLQLYNLARRHGTVKCFF